MTRFCIITDTARKVKDGHCGLALHSPRRGHQRPPADDGHAAFADSRNGMDALTHALRLRFNSGHANDRRLF